jgi:hypothetical protein
LVPNIPSPSETWVVLKRASVSEALADILALRDDGRRSAREHSDADGKNLRRLNSWGLAIVPSFRRPTILRIRAEGLRSAPCIIRRPVSLTSQRHCAQRSLLFSPTRRGYEALDKKKVAWKEKQSP